MSAARREPLSRSNTLHLILCEIPEDLELTDEQYARLLQAWEAKQRTDRPGRLSDREVRTLIGKALRPS